MRRFTVTFKTGEEYRLPLLAIAFPGIETPAGAELEYLVSLASA